MTTIINCSLNGKQGDTAGVCRELRLYNLTANLDRMIHEAQQSKLPILSSLRESSPKRWSAEGNGTSTEGFPPHIWPARHDLDDFDYNFSSGINRQQMKELRELVWLEQSYNIILMGPSGTGKTYIAAGLVYEAVKNGQKAT